MKKFTDRQKKAINYVSKKLGIIPEKLIILINFETAGTFNPKIKNPNSSARGLLQFTDLSSRGLGFRNSLDLINRLPTIELQLIKAVYPYLEKYKPFRNDQELFLSVFYPAARRWSLDRPFPISVQRVNPGIKTPRDYIKKVYKHGSSKKNIILITSLLVGGFYLLSKGIRKNGK